MRPGSLWSVSAHSGTWRNCSPKVYFATVEDMELIDLHLVRSSSLGGGALELSEESTSSTVTPDVSDILFNDEFSPEYDTGHELESRYSVEGWEAIRIGLRNVVTESAAMPLEQI